MTKRSFSTLFGSNDAPATETFRPFINDDEARRARDIDVFTLRKAGFKVRKHTLRNQLREYWAWGVPCGRSCTVYEYEILN